jgi:septum formation inhibitor MinC
LQTYHKVQLVRTPLSHTSRSNDSFNLNFSKSTRQSQCPSFASQLANHKASGSDSVLNNNLQILQLEKKKLEYERLREQKRRFEAEMQLLDLQQRKEEQELAQMQEDLGRNNNNNNNPTAGHQSEPTTPPEYRETNSGFPSVFSRPNRYSTSSLTSPPGLYNRPGRSGSQLTSPQSGIIQSRLIMDDKLPSKSVPGSRRNSDEDEKEEAVRQDPTSHRSTNAYVHVLLSLNALLARSCLRVSVFKLSDIFTFDRMLL